MLERYILEQILTDNILREEKILSPWACRSSQGRRLHPQREKVPDHKNIRSVFFHDTDKIIHSLAYARYIDKTQVFSFFENDHITHRVLHVQFVSKIARVIGRVLRLNEDLIEAISLGHDIGHPPFGHEGESVLNKLCHKYKIGGFSHNVQSVRFLMELENRGAGLNLSLQVLDGILSHNGERIEQRLEFNPRKNWGIFLSQYKRALRDEKFSRNIVPMTLEACVVRIADVIAYIGRDIEDAIKLNIIKRKEIPLRVKKILGDRNDKIINTLVNDVIENSRGKDCIVLSKNVYRALRELRDFNYRRIYFNEEIKGENSYKVRQMFFVLFENYRKDFVSCRKKYRNMYYPELRNFVLGMHKEYLENNHPARIISDFIAGMTDKFFLNQFKKMVLPQSFGLKLHK